MEEIQAKNNQLKKEYGYLFEAIAETLIKHDPIGIYFGENDDEYYPEVRTILPRLKNCEFEDDVLAVVYEEFVKWFDEQIAGVKDNYTQIAKEIWALWHIHKIKN